MKEKKNNNLFLVAGICFILCALIEFILKNHTLGTIYLSTSMACLAASTVGLGTTESEEDKKEDNQVEENN